jgi:tight adherence protein B
MIGLCALLVVVAGATARPAVWAARRARVRARLGLFGGGGGRARPRRTLVTGATVSVGVLAVVLGVAASGAGALAIVGVPLAAASVGLVRLLRGGRAERRFVEGLPDALDAVARAAAAGVSAAEAVRQGAAAASGDLAGDLAGVVADVERGSTLVEALEAWARRRERAEVDLVASGLAMAIVTGGSVSWVAHHLADAVRANLESRAAVVAQAAQARASAVVMGATPVAVLVVTTIVDPTATSVLFGTAIGQTCLVAGLLLAGLAIWWMAAIIRSAEVAVT